MLIAASFISLNAVCQGNYILKNNVKSLYRPMPEYQLGKMPVDNVGGGKETAKNPYSATFQLHTNSLYDLALCPNVGLEFQTSLGLAFQFDYIGAWWNSPSRNRFYSNYAFQSEIRYYFSNDHTTIRPFRGLHAGVYGQMATYDFEFGSEGYQSPSLEMSWGLGLSGGYTLPISRKWSLDFTLGFGYFQSKYYTYDPKPYIQKSWQKTGTKRFTFWGPTKAEVSLVWNINKSNK